MFAAIVLAAVTAASSPAPAAQSQAAYKPLREVVYNVVTNLQINQTTEQFPGYNPQDPGLPNSVAGPPASTAETGLYGTVTVDVMAVAPDGTLGIHVTELWTNGTGKPVSFDGVVTPDGVVEFPNQTINDVTRELLIYFGTKFAPTDGLSQGTAWQVDQHFSNGDVLTDYSVTKVDGDLVTIHKTQDLKKFNLYTDGTITYDPGGLVPISGLVTRRMTGSTFENAPTEFEGGTTQSRDRTLTLKFNRVSDTRQAKPSR
jgi:hypothetical protein